LLRRAALAACAGARLWAACSAASRSMRAAMNPALGLAPGRTRLGAQHAGPAGGGVLRGLALGCWCGIASTHRQGWVLERGCMWQEGCNSEPCMVPQSTVLPAAPSSRPWATLLPT
jgi:hypothetical protein